MSVWSFLYPFVLSQVRGCDTDTVDFHARQAAIDFCKRSQAWRQELPITAVADQEAYVIPLPTDSAVSMLLSFEVLDTCGNSTDDYEPVNAGRGRRLERASRSGAWVYLSDDGLSINVQPIPDDTVSQLIPYVSLKPTQTAAGLPDFLMEENADALAAGTLARLFDMDKTAWTDKAAALSKRGEFLQACGVANVRASRGNARSKTRSRGFFY